LSYEQLTGSSPDLARTKTENHLRVRVEWNACLIGTGWPITAWDKESAGKIHGYGGQKKWGFSEATALLLRGNTQAKGFVPIQEKPQARETPCAVPHAGHCGNRKRALPGTRLGMAI